MFPILVYFYVRLAKREEQEALVMFEEEYKNYMRNIPGFIPRILSKQTSASRSSR
jgi:protein-S-isoprenylcysteine O-methyltransferase Ste14